MYFIQNFVHFLVSFVVCMYLTFLHTTSSLHHIFIFYFVFSFFSLQPSMSTPFQTAQPAQSSGTFAFSNFGQTQPVQRVVLLPLAISARHNLMVSSIF
jgi:hypothetical protein